MKNNLLPRGLFYIQDMYTEKFLTFSDFLFLSITVGVTTTTHLPTDTTPPNQFLKRILTLTFITQINPTF